MRCLFNHQQAAIWQTAMQVFTHARRGDAVFAAEHEQHGALHLRQQGAGIGAHHGIQRGLQAGRHAVADDFRQHFVGEVGAFRDVQKLQL